MAEMIDLQVGARTFRTTRETLTRSEASYFCGFLSDRFTVPRTPDGTYFIDRNGDAFEVILEYLRSGKILLTNSRVPVDLIRSEAEYYAMMDFVEDLDLYVSELGIAKKEKADKKPRFDGYYMNRSSGPDRRIIQFQEEGRLKYLRGEQSDTNILVLNAVQKIPELWKADDSIVDNYAHFCNNVLLRGTYQQEDDLIKIRVTLNGPELPGVFQKDKLLLPVSFHSQWAEGGFECYHFSSF